MDYLKLPDDNNYAEDSSFSYGLEERLVNFAVSIVDFTAKFRKDQISLYYMDQLIRSSSSAALNFGESRGTVTHKDYMYKISLVLKELNESNVCLKILSRTTCFKEYFENESILKEANELVSIFFSSLKKLRAKNG